MRRPGALALFAAMALALSPVEPFRPEVEPLPPPPRPPPPPERDAIERAVADGVVLGRGVLPVEEGLRAVATYRPETLEVTIDGKRYRGLTGVSYQEHAAARARHVQQFECEARISPSELDTVKAALAKRDRKRAARLARRSR